MIYFFSFYMSDFLYPSPKCLSLMFQQWKTFCYENCYVFSLLVLLLSHCWGNNSAVWSCWFSPKWHPFEDLLCPWQCLLAESGWKIFENYVPLLTLSYLSVAGLILYVFLKSQSRSLMVLGNKSEWIQKYSIRKTLSKSDKKQTMLTYSQF